MLKKLRVVLAILFCGLLTFYLVDFAGLLPETFHWLGHIQLVPILMAGLFIIAGALLLLTWLFGRFYCSAICPLGVYQDGVGWLSKRFVRKKKYKYSKPKTVLRWAIFGAVVFAFVFGFQLLVNLLDPYSAYGRIVAHLFRPIYIAGNNLLESVFSHFGDYTFYREKVVVQSLSSFIVAWVTLLIVGFLAWRYGRTYCNTICPVGTLLGCVSRYSLYKVRIDPAACTRCGICATRCKASCINFKEKRVDNSRCVDCFNCLGSCPQNALMYTARSRRVAGKKPVEADRGRRAFLRNGTAAVVFMPLAAVQASERSRSLAGGAPIAPTPISPPGSHSAERMKRRCTACHLCISRCPSRVLKPAYGEYGVDGMMMPVMYFERGYCNYDCTVCTQICPNGALEPLTVEEKHSTQTGHVVFLEHLCVTVTNGTNCGACAEHCPTQAVTMVPYRDGLTIPRIDSEICVGCGGCEFICPVRPQRAIYVEGNPVHLEAKPFEEEVHEEKESYDFGF